MQVTYGPIEILACPACRKPLGRQTYSIVIHIDEDEVVRWSDGKVDDPGIPNLPDVTVTRCDHCSSYFWIKDATVLGEIPHEKAVDEGSGVNMRPEWAGMLLVKPLDAEALADAVATTNSPAREKESRIRLWHLLNDPCRTDIESGKERPEIFYRNLDALMEILDEIVPDERLLKAEALRERGRHEDALKLLADAADALAANARQIAWKARVGNTYPFKYLPAGFGDADMEELLGVQEKLECMQHELAALQGGKAELILDANNVAKVEEFARAHLEQARLLIRVDKASARQLCRRAFGLFDRIRSECGRENPGDIAILAGMLRELGQMGDVGRAEYLERRLASIRH